MRYLSKSQFTRGLQCPKSLWLYRERKDLRDEVSPYQQAIFDQGTQVGLLAQKWIKGGVLITADHTQPELALEETQAAIAAGAKVLYEAAALYDDVLVRVDILARNPEGDWDLFEVKSTTEVEETHLQDAAIQRYVLAGAGFKVTHTHVVHLDPGYVRYGALNLTSLFKAVDVTEETNPLVLEAPVHLKAMKKVAQADEAPAAAIGPRCSKPHDCDFTGHCWAHVPEYSVWNLAGARGDKKFELWNNGVKTIADIPNDTKLTAYQQVQRLVARSGKPHIDIAAIAKLLEGLSFPRYFLDFEAINPAVPAYDGLRPYQALPFEASIHTQAERGAPLEHHEFLADGTRDPRRDLIAFLRAYCGGSGPIIAYHKSYEGGIIKGLHSWGDTPGLLNLEARLWDLADPFRKGFYAHPASQGSWSIKKILPVLVPDMTYDGLFIKDGTAAMQAYMQLMDPSTTAAERAAIMTALRLYCGQDTLGMVRILDRLEEIVQAGVAA